MSDAAGVSERERLDAAYRTGFDGLDPDACTTDPEWADHHASGLRAVAAQAWDDGAVQATVDAKRVLRGEGEPGNAGESIDLNYADDLLDEMAAEYREGDDV